MSLIGQTIQDRYRIRYQIGEGGMGRVYYAEDLRLKQPVAIKETLGLDNNESSLQIEAKVKALQREAHLLAGSIKHHAIPRVIDHFQIGENWYVVMDYVDGDSLEKQLREREQPFPIKDVLLWTNELLQILDSLHSGDTQIVHCDIKPSNIKVKDGKVYLLDFGLAKRLTGSKTSIAFLTPAYAPPEQKNLTPKSDLYSVGATMYCLLTDTEPSSAYARSLAIASGETDPLKSIKEFRPDVPMELARLIMSSLSIKPEERPDSAKNMQVRLMDLLIERGQNPTLPTHNFLSNYDSPLPKPSRVPSAASSLRDDDESSDFSNGKYKTWKKIAVGVGLVAAIALVGVGTYKYARKDKAPKTPVSTKSPRQLAIELTDQAIKKIYESNYEEAKSLSKKAIDIDQTHALAYAIYGDAFWDSNQSEEDSSKDPKSQISKAEILKLFDTKEPSADDEYAARAWAFLIDDKWDRARQDIGKIKTSNWAWALALRASILSNGVCIKEKESKEADEVVETLKQVNRLEPAYANAYRQLGNQYGCIGKIPEAISSYQQAVNHWQSAFNYTELGNLYFYLDEKNKKKQEQNLEEAKQKFLRATEIDSEFSRAYIGLAQFHAAKSEYKECITEANNALSRKDSADGNYWWSMCRYPLASKDKDEKGFDEALEKIQKAIQLTKRSEVPANKRNRLAEYYYTEAGIRNVKAIYLYNVKYKNDRVSGRQLARKEFEAAQVSINNALSIEENNKQFQAVKSAIDKSLRVLK
jgi:tetratricopeptide (TPR) repeat protein